MCTAMLAAGREDITIYGDDSQTPRIHRLLRLRTKVVCYALYIGRTLPGRAAATSCPWISHGKGHSG